MTTRETFQASMEARRAVGSSSAPGASRESAVQTYLRATAQLSHPATPGVGAARPAVGVTALTDSVLTPAAGAARPFVVIAGIDASRCSRRAARWAAAEAVRRGGSLVLVHAYSLPPAGYSGYNPYPANLLPQLREEGADLLGKTADALRVEHPTLSIDTRMIYGDPATVLRHASATAQLTVVGARGGSRIVSALGSVIAGIVTTNPGPVVVIHPGALTAPTGPIVVGVDGSPNSDAAVGFAFEAASLCGVPLVAVHCWTDPIIVGDLPYFAEGIVDTDCLAIEQRCALDQALVPWSAAFPNVVVQPVVIHGRPTPALLEMSRTAQLTVVGSHGQGAAAGWLGGRLLLGSTSVALMTHSPNPVVIVRPVSPS